MTRYKHNLGPGLTAWDKLPSSEQDFNAILLEQARDAGCTCNPDIEAPKLKRGEVAQAKILHDDDCELIRRLES